jgi:signal transduction histidine kinase
MSAWQARLRLLFRTSAMRLALRYALLQVGVLALALLGLFWTTYSYVQQEIQFGLVQELATLRGLPQPLLIARIQALAAYAPGGQRLRDYLLVTPEGVQFGSPVGAWPDGLPLDGKVYQVQVSFEDTGLDRDADALVPAIASALADGSRLLIAQEAGRLEDMRDVLPWVAGALLLLAAGLSLTLGFALGRRWLGRVDAINHTAASIMGGSLTARIPLSARSDEFDELARHLNAMLERIEQAVTGMRGVSDHIAHDLRKPLSRLKTRLELALRENRPQAEQREAMQRAIEDADEMMRSFEAMLAISRLESGSEILAPESLDLSALLTRVSELYADEAEEAGRPFVMRIDQGLVMRGSAPLLGQAFANLLDNAFLHTAAGTAVEVRAGREDKDVVVEFIDHGTGIPHEQRARMTDRFSRGENARTLPGSGLGLALASAVVKAHHGSMTLADTPQGGLTVLMRFSLDPAT